MTKLLLLVFSFFTLYAFELPKVKIQPSTQPEIIIFKVQSVLVNNNPSYKLIWKTVNTTKVEITYLGELELSGSFIITQDEYNRGEITLRASSKDSKHVAIRILNSNSAQNKSTPMKQKEENYEMNQQQYYRQYYPGGMHNPINRGRRLY